MKTKKTGRELPTILFWKILRKSRIFNYWYRKHLNELLFDIELADIEKERIKDKYLKKLKEI